MKTAGLRPCTLLFHAEDRESAWRDAFARCAPQIRFCSWPEWDPADGAEYALVWKPRRGELARHPSLRAIFSIGAGIDHLSSDPEIPASVPVVRMVDRSLTRGMSEYVLLNVLLHHREMTVFFEQQRRRIWKPRVPAPSDTRTVGVMGMGTLGSDVLSRLKPLGFKLRGWSRTPKRLAGVDSFAGPDQLSAFLGGLDILVCLLPLTADTRGILNRRTFSQLARGAALISAGRGEHVNEQDLLTALESGRIRAASLDVFQEEPLPDDHPLWRHPNVVVTPHVASVTLPHTAVPGIVRQIRNHQNGGELSNVADIARGY